MGKIVMVVKQQDSINFKLFAIKLFYVLARHQGETDQPIVSQGFLFNYEGFISPFPDDGIFTRLPKLLSDNEQCLSPRCPQHLWIQLISFHDFQVSQIVLNLISKGGGSSPSQSLSLSSLTWVVWLEHLLVKPNAKK